MKTNTVEKARIEMGFTKPQMLKVMGLPPEHNSIFAMPEPRLAMPYKDRANELAAAYREWRDDLYAAVKADEQLRGRRMLSAMEVARLINISEFHLSQLRLRQEVGATEIKPRRYVYSHDNVRALIKSNSLVISPETRKQRGPLANAFMNSLVAEMAIAG